MLILLRGLIKGSAGVPAIPSLSLENQKKYQNHQQQQPRTDSQGVGRLCFLCIWLLPKREGKDKAEE